jgi:CHAT domain-containing protein
MTEYYYYTGEFANAFSVIDSAYTIFIDDNNLYGIANTHLVEGNTYNLIGNAPDALKHYSIADSIYLSLEDPLSSATAINNMGTIAFMQGDYNQALKLFDRCLHILDSVGLNLSLKITVTCNLGEVYMERGIWDEAEYFFNRSIDLAEKMGATRNVWNNRTMMGKLKSKQGKYTESNQIVIDCYNAYQKSDEKMAIAECATIIGKNYYELKNNKKATEYLNIALKIYQGIGSKKMLWEPLYYLALAEQEQNNFQAAVEYLKAAVENIEVLSSDIIGDNSQKKLFAKANNKKDIYQSLITLLVMNGDVKDAWVYQEKLNVYGLDEQTRGENTRGASMTADDDELVDLELKKDGIYNQLMLEKAKPVGERSDAKIAELEKRMSVASEDYQNFFWDLVDKGEISNDFANTVNPEDLDSKRFNMDEDIIVLQYLVTDDKLIIFIASSDTLGAKIVDLNQSNLEKYVTRYYSLLTSRAPIESIYSASEQLYKTLIEPVIPFIETKKKIAFVPGGILVKLPFQSLGYFSNNSFNYLGSQYNIFYINDMNNTVIVESLTISDANLLAFGNADNTLPFAEKEVSSISQFFTTPSIYIKNEAVENIAKNSMNNYQIVHFATHGNLDPINFKNTYLTLAPNPDLNEDGMLTMNEINRIRTLRNCQLIVLSACNTAVNDEKLEGWINNPAKAFLRKGAKTAVASLWAVDDAATGEMMKSFYQNLFAGQNKIDALANAQKSLITSDKFSHPFYWAAFELLGQWK